MLKQLLTIVLIGLASLMGTTSANAAEYEATFKQLGFQEALNIRGVNGQISVPFSVRADEVVLSASVNLLFNYSPSMLDDLSHFNIIVNGEAIESVPLTKDNAGKISQRTVNIPVRLLAQFNRLSLELIGHYTLGCEDPVHSTLWLNVSNFSKLNLTTAALPLGNDLGLLPAPFFDPRDRLPMVTPIAFAGTPNNTTIEAAGVVASWLGGLASYRGYSFPVSVGSLPADSNVIVFLLPGQTMPGLTLPQSNGPRLTMQVHPGNDTKKVLVISGRDENDLKTAVKALVLGTQSMNGSTLTVDGEVVAAPRVPYDAPRWISSNRETKLGDLVDQTALQVSGQYPDLIRVPMTMPPDLFFWRSSGIPLDLKHRYTLRTESDKSTLNVSFSDKFIQAIPLRSEQDMWPFEKWIRGVLKKPASVNEESVSIPREAFSPNGQLQLYFHFDVIKSGECKDAPINNIQAAVDKESTIDISGFPKFMHMPELSTFANAGFPFTRMADLSETAVVIPAQASTATLSNVFTLLGRVGDLTGLPAYGFTLVRPNDLANVSDKDLLLVGSFQGDELFKKWADSMPLEQSNQLWQVKTGGGFTSFVQQWAPWLGQKSQLPVTSLSLQGVDPSGFMVGFESPENSGRSVVAIVGSETGVSKVLGAILSPDDVQLIRGSVVFVKGSSVASVLDEKTYSVGSLPIWIWIQYYLAELVLLNVIFLLGAALLFAFVLNRILKDMAKKRLERRE